MGGLLRRMFLQGSVFSGEVGEMGDLLIGSRKKRKEEAMWEDSEGLLGGWLVHKRWNRRKSSFGYPKNFFSRFE